MGTQGSLVFAASTLLLGILLSGCNASTDDPPGDEVDWAGVEGSVSEAAGPLLSFDKQLAPTLRVEMGPCDDDCYFSIDGAPTISLRINQTHVQETSLADGVHDLRFRVVNGGCWGWKGKLRVLVDGREIWSIDQEGGSGLNCGTMIDESRQVRIRDGQLMNF